MRRTVIPGVGAVAAVAAVVVGAALAGTSASIYTYKATMSVGAERPKPSAPAAAKGVFTATVTESGSTRLLKWKLTYSGLSGNAVAAHVHKGKAGVAGAVLVPLCGPCKSGQTGQVKIKKDIGDAMERGLTYVNVHTAKNAAGEIRGQVKLVGEHEGTAPAATSPTTTSPSGGGDDSGGYTPPGY